MPSSTFVAQRIREARADAGLTQEQLAAEVSVTPRAVGMWEGSARTPRMGHLAALARALDRPVEFFFEPESERADAA